jgi:hypothetical protein
MAGDESEPELGGALLKLAFHFGGSLTDIILACSL